MLGGRISNHDEEEVEDELAALEAEMSGRGQALPNVPNAQVPLVERDPERQSSRTKQTERQAMLAS